MAALTEARSTVEVQLGSTLVLPVAAATKIFDGALVVLDESGYAAPASKADKLKAAGRAECLADNSGGTAGAISVTVRRGVYLWDNDTTNPVTIAHVMGPCYIVDDHTVCSLATGSSIAGTVLGIDGETGQVIVETR